MSEEGKPSWEDYMAGSILTCGVVWAWSMIMGLIQRSTQGSLGFAVAAFSYVVYAMGGAMASYIVSRKATRRHLVVGVKMGLASWGANMLIVFPFLSERSPGAMVVLLVSLLAGSVAGALTRGKLAGRRGRG